LGLFKAGFANQPVAHTQTLWNFLGMALAGLGFVLMGGCPLRQLVAASEGHSDAAAAVLGMVFGAALAHNFGLAAGPAGVPPAGKLAVVAGLVVLTAYATANALAARAGRRLSGGEVPAHFE
ncbi:MAG: YedE-related selenium metabolism membrane protein, partial [Bacillota bacterium]